MLDMRPPATGGSPQVEWTNHLTKCSEDVDIYYIYYDGVSVCLSVTKNHHFLLGVSCDYLNYL